MVLTLTNGINSCTYACRMLIIQACILICLFPRSINSVAIDNEIAAPPQIECLQDNIKFTVETKEYFAGRIYAKGLATEPSCVASGFSSYQTTNPTYTLPLGICGMKSLRSMNPRGMYYGITVVVSFHPLFLTKVDQAFHVKCFFEEANRGVTAEIGVSMIPTTESSATHVVPGCVYSIHSSTIHDLDSGFGAGQTIQFARIGDKILHKWECADPMYGVLVRNCYVTDGLGQRAEVIDELGCPIDPILITGIRYAANLSTAYAESHVFKFADRPAVWFFCQIQMCMKTSNLCSGVTPPSCSGLPVNPADHGAIPINPGPNPAVPGSLFPSSNSFPSSTIPYELSHNHASSLSTAGSYDYDPAHYEASYDDENLPIYADREGSSLNLVFEKFDSSGVGVDPKIAAKNASDSDYEFLFGRRTGFGSVNRIDEPKGSFEAPVRGGNRLMTLFPPIDPGEVAGQLIVYDLDEDPPSLLQISKSELVGFGNGSTDLLDLDGFPQEDDSSGPVRSSAIRPCLITPTGLAVLLVGFAVIIVLLLVTLWLVTTKSKRKKACSVEQVELATEHHSKSTRWRRRLFGRRKNPGGTKSNSVQGYQHYDQGPRRDTSVISTLTRNTVSEKF